jgi:hypothetical protein
VLIAGPFSHEGVKRRLEGGAEHDAGKLVEDAFRAIAVVDIEIDDGHLLESMLMHGMRRRYGHIVEKAETHGPVPFGMMTGWPDVTKGYVCVNR